MIGRLLCFFGRHAWERAPESPIYLCTRPRCYAIDTARFAR